MAASGDIDMNGVRVGVSENMFAIVMGGCGG